MAVQSLRVIFTFSFYQKSVLLCHKESCFLVVWGLGFTSKCVRIVFFLVALGIELIPSYMLGSCLSRELQLHVSSF